MTEISNMHTEYGSVRSWNKFYIFCPFGTFTAGSVRSWNEFYIFGPSGTFHQLADECWNRASW